MPVKMTGAQYKAFLASEWGPDAMWEGAEIAINGEMVPEDFYDDERDLMKDEDIVTVSGGEIFPDQTNKPHHSILAEPFARKWLKAQKTVTLMVDVPRELADQFATMIAALGTEGNMAKVVGRVG